MNWEVPSVLRWGSSRTQDLALKTHYSQKLVLLSVTSLTNPAFAVVKLNHSS